MRKLLLGLMAFLLFTGQLLAQKTITGKVTDDKGNPVPNASVVVKGTSTGTTTKADGSYTLTVPSNASTLVVSSIGVRDQELSIGSGSVLNFTMVSTAQDLGEVVVTVPYGTIKKTSFTGAETTVGSKQLESQNVTSVTRALDGLVPGIIATNGGGAPGTGASIRIRGIGSVNASSEPLYVLDGAVYNGSIAALSMDDIATVTVLKDAAATSLYGARAGNGVIMLTSKKGVKGRTNVTANVRQGYMSRSIPEYDRVGIKDYYELMWEGNRNALLYAPGATISMAAANQAATNTIATSLVYNPFDVADDQIIDPATGKLNPNANILYQDDWQDVLIRSGAPRRDVGISISTGTDKSDFLMSLGNVDEEGITKFSGYNRYTARLNMNTQATNWLKTGLSFDGAVARQLNVPSGGTATTNPFYYTRMMGPIYPVWQRDAEGAFVLDPTTGERVLDYGIPSQMGTRPYAGNSNLLGTLELDKRNNKIANANAATYIEIKLPAGFGFRTAFNATFYDAYQTTYQNSQFGDADNVSGRSTKATNRQLTTTFNQVLSWTKDFGANNLRVLAGHESYEFTQNVANATRTGFPFPGTDELAPAAVAEGSTSYENKHRIESYFGQANYALNDRYLASASFRRDGTSRFYKDVRWGNFYSVGAGWRISQESFMQNINWLNELKIRASYGENGNESLEGFYKWQALYDLGWNNGNAPGAVQGSLANEPLLWEKNKVTNIGADFALFNNRLQGTIEWFNRASGDLLFPFPLAPSTGFSEISRNIGSLTNKGIEVQLGYNLISKADFDWRIDVNLTHFENRLTKLPQETMPQAGNNKYRLGGSVFEYSIKEFAGVDASNGDALYYQDILGTDGKPTGERKLTNNLTQASFYYHGDAIPDLTGGVTNTFRYKNFTLSALVTFSVGGKFLDGNYLSLMHPGSYGTAWSTDILNRWQKPGDVTNIPRLQNALTTQNGTSTRYLFDGSYLNIKNINLSYNLPRSVASKIGMSNGRIFTSVDNAVLFTTRKGMDPQRSFDGSSDWSYPPYRTITVGIQVNLQ